MRICLFILLLTLTACYTPATPTDFENSRKYDLSKDKVWEKVVQFFAENNLPVETIEKDSGIIYAQPSIFGRSLADCGKFGSFEAAAEAEGIARLNVFVKPEAARKTQVTVNISFDSTSYQDDFIYGRKRIECYSKGILEQQILDYVGK